MDIEVKNAVSVFYATSSFDDVYCEAVANAIDAHATQIDILVCADKFTKPETLKIKISDNGDGFNGRNYDKFSTLLKVDGNDHKGVGRLVYLTYFQNVHIKSVFDGNKKREFDFNDKFTADAGRAEVEVAGEANGTILELSGFKGKKLNKHANAQASDIKTMLLNKFLPRLYAMKSGQKVLLINIRNEVGDTSKSEPLFPEEENLTLDDVPSLKERVLEGEPKDLFGKSRLLYLVSQSKTNEICCYICVDGRAMPYDLIPNDSIPSGYRVQILIESETMGIMADSGRQKLVFSDALHETCFKGAVLKALSQILEEEIPDIKKQNRCTYDSFQKAFPHLYGLYDVRDAIGLASKKSMIEAARNSLFKKQCRILQLKEDELSENDVEDVKQLAARSLMEYVLYRSYIIEQLKLVDKEKSEADIHNILVPRYRQFDDLGSDRDLYNNNVWLLDDKFMSYDTTMSEAEMRHVFPLLNESAKDVNANNTGRPDITVVFSGDPNKEDKVDVVMVELKKYGIKKNEEVMVIEQLRDRARDLIDYFNAGKIGRMWFFGVVEMTKDFMDVLDEKGYQSVFSRGNIFYMQEQVKSKKTGMKSHFDVYLMDYETLVKDAEMRNASFMEVMKRRIREFSEQVRMRRDETM